MMIITVILFFLILTLSSVQSDQFFYPCTENVLSIRPGAIGLFSVTCDKNCLQFSPKMELEFPGLITSISCNNVGTCTVSNGTAESVVKNPQFFDVGKTQIHINNQFFSYYSGNLDPYSDALTYVYIKNPDQRFRIEYHVPVNCLTLSTTTITTTVKSTTIPPTTTTATTTTTMNPTEAVKPTESQPEEKPFVIRFEKPVKHLDF